VLIGLIAPPLAEWAKPLMGVAVFVFTLGAFLKVDVTSFRAECTDRRGNVLILVWATFGVPLLVDTLVQIAIRAPISRSVCSCARSRRWERRITCRR
jgi:hypothetical protein